MKKIIIKVVMDKFMKKRTVYLDRDFWLSVFFQIIKKFFILVAIILFIVVFEINRGKEVTTERIKLISLSFSKELEGTFHQSFTIGYGSIDTKKYFVAYQVNSDGGKEICEMDANITVIYDTLGEDESPYAEIDSDGYGKTKAIRLYVPKNTIHKNIDLELVEREVPKADGYYK